MSRLTERADRPAGDRADVNRPRRGAEGRRPPTFAAMSLRRLLAGAAIGGHAGALAAIGIAWATGGVPTALSAALGAVLALAFSMIGHGVQLAFADGPPERLLLAALTSYLVRVGLLGGALALVLSNAAGFGWLQRAPLALGAVTVVVTWLAAEIWVFSRLRIPVWDAPDDADRPTGANPETPRLSRRDPSSGH
ncbi:hypothetical protein [Nigerium massiliense]|uniref:hypothetical protein n=1 Tax=Nigerium massiliense TaxID=1522317 RepID=UPI000693DB46|nr:hypothetical protein [Nigerium massiliense]